MSKKGAEKQLSGDGHRKRLRNRFLQGGLDGFLNYEIIELLLTLGTPPRYSSGACSPRARLWGMPNSNFH